MTLGQFCVGRVAFWARAFAGAWDASAGNGADNGAWENDTGDAWSETVPQAWHRGAVARSAERDARERDWSFAGAEARSHKILGSELQTLREMQGGSRVGHCGRSALTKECQGSPVNSSSFSATLRPGLRFPFARSEA